MRPVDRPDASATAQAALRHVARLTNLGLAATPTGIVGNTPLARELTGILRRIGAQIRPINTGVPVSVELLILTGDTPFDTESIEPGDRPLIILDLATQVDRDRLAGLPAVPARDGIVGRRAGRELFLLAPLSIGSASETG